jgi:hypothetical protein
MKRLYLPIILALSAYALFLSGCTTGRGHVFESVVEAEASTEDTESGVSESEAQEGEEPALEVQSSPDEAEVYLNGEYVGETPVTVDDLDAGEYRVTIEHSGYYSYTQWISISEERSYTLSVTLEAVTGFLSVTSNVGDPEIVVGDTTIDTGVAELPVGTYTVRARAFGYRPITRSVRIRENGTTHLDLEFQEAAFEIEDVGLSRYRFAPANPGVLGRTTLHFSVSGPGTGVVQVYSPSGDPILSDQLGPFRTWDQRWEWDGTDREGNTVPDGEYRIELEARSGAVVETESRAVVLDSSRRIRYHGALGTTAGSLYATTPYVLPPGSFQFGTSFTGHRSATTAGIVGRYPVAATLRIGLPADIEVVAGGIAVLYENVDYTRGIGGLSVRYRYVGSPSFSAAVAARATVHSKAADGDWSAPDSFANYLGGGIVLPVAYELGAFQAILAPELAVSPYPVSYGDGSSEAGFYAWGYGRWALRYDVGTFAAAVSGSVRTLPFRQAFSAHLPFVVGAEAHLMIPETPIYVSGLLSAEITDADNFFLTGGGGIGIVY